MVILYWPYSAGYSTLPLTISTDGAGVIVGSSGSGSKKKRGNIFKILQKYTLSMIFGKLIIEGYI